MDSNLLRVSVRIIDLSKLVFYSGKLDYYLYFTQKYFPAQYDCQNNVLLLPRVENDWKSWGERPLSIIAVGTYLSVYDS